MPGTIDCYTFMGNNGDHVRVRVVGTDGTFVPYTQIIKPNGTTLCGPSTDIEQTCRLTTTGQHRVMIRDQNGTGTGAYTVYIQRLDGPVKCTTIALGDPALAGAITVVGDAHCYTFDGTAGHHIQVEVLATDGTIVPNTELVKPDGVTLLGPSTLTDQQIRLTTTGTYTVEIRDLAGPNLGGYTVAVSEI